MKKIGLIALAGLIAVCAGPGAWAQGTLGCPVTDDLDGLPAPAAHDADFLTINANTLWDNFPGTPKEYDNLFSDDELTIFDNAADLSAATSIPQSFFETALIPDVIWLGLLDRAVTDTDFPDHAAICQAYSENLDAADAYNTAVAGEGFGGLLAAFEGGNEIIAGVMTLNPDIWAPIINVFIAEAAIDAFGSAPTTQLDAADFTAVPALDWTGTVGTNENTNVELFLALGATFVNGGWEVDSGSKAVFTFTTEQLYETFGDTVLDDGDTTLLSGTIIPQVPTGAPVSGPVGLGLLTLAVAGGGALLLRRKK